MELPDLQGRVTLEDLVITVPNRTEPILKGITLTIEPGTPSGKVVTLRGKGIPAVHGRGRGDQLIQLVVEVPKQLTPRGEQLLRRACVIQEIRCHYNIERLRELRGSRISGFVADAQGFFLLAGFGQVDHLCGEVDSNGVRGPERLDDARVMSLATCQIEHGLAAHITEQHEQTILLDMMTPWDELGALVLLGDGIVVRRHSELG